MNKINYAKSVITELLHEAGITVNGGAPYDIQIHNEQFYAAVLADKDLGLGESYMDGWWDCPRVDLFIDKAIRAGVDKKIKTNFKFLFKLLLAKLINFQSKSRAFEVGRKHYDIGNDLFTAMLDKEMNYTCGYWKNAQDLDAAQIAKLELTCKKLKLQPGMSLLDIGCGWGALAKYAAKNFGVNVVGITISKEQAELAQKRCQGLSVEIRLQDYRDINQKFDRIVSLGMFEHVGHLNYATYMDVVNRNLDDDGLFLLHTIGSNITTTTTNAWINKYIFPNGMLPSIVQISKAFEGKFVMEDWHNFGAYYYPTLLAWHQNFNQHWDELKSSYDERFRRMWNFYLLYSAGGFKSCILQLWQIVLSKNGIEGGYDAPR